MFAGIRAGRKMRYVHKHAMGVAVGALNGGKGGLCVKRVRLAGFRFFPDDFSAARCAI